jgi:hypothetical protein
MSTTRSIVALILFSAVGCAKPDRTPTTTPDTAPQTTPPADTPTADVPPADTPTAAFVAGPGGVPLPQDAVQNTEMPNAGGKMSVYEVPRSREEVGAELKANLAADGWTIDSEELSPRFKALRLKVSKNGATIDARVSGDDAKAGIIITLP